MLLGALTELHALDDLPVLLDSLAELGVRVSTTQVSRAGMRATSVSVTAGDGEPHRHLGDVRRLIAAAAAPDEVRRRAVAVFTRLATAEAKVHGTSPDEVTFHEVGAVDSIIDVLGGCLGLHALALDELVVGPIALGGGTAATGHGEVPVPTPAALELLADSDLVAAGGDGGYELATPTGIALLAEWATATGSMPAVQVAATGIGAGSRDPAERANVVRLIVGSAASATLDETWLTVEANVDDLDPRLWPGVLQRLIDAGAADAWLTPILMKKGRPAHTVSALLPAGHLDKVQAVLFSETSTIGARATTVTKRALDRSWLAVDVDGQSVRVKLATDDGRVVNVAPEFEDVATAAAVLGVPVKDVLARASAAAHTQLDG
jgi:hypothetical protein